MIPSRTTLITKTQQKICSFGLKNPRDTLYEDDSSFRVHMMKTPEVKGEVKLFASKGLASIDADGIVKSIKAIIAS